MERYDEMRYGERIADIYDELYSDYEEVAVDLLQELAGRGRVLELGIGTGRVALPLAHRGVQVTGIDASEAMIEKLRAKRGGGGIEVVQGNFVEIDLEGRFGLVYNCVQYVFRPADAGGAGSVFSERGRAPDRRRCSLDRGFCTGSVPV